MEHLLIRVREFEIVDEYTLRVEFDDGQERTINFEPVLYGYYYGPLRDLDLFNQVYIDEEIHTLVWPNEADFDPATLYNWHQGEGAELAAKALSWRETQLHSSTV